MGTNTVFAGQSGKVRFQTAPGTRAKVSILSGTKVKTVKLGQPKAA